MEQDVKGGSEMVLGHLPCIVLERYRKLKIIEISS